VSSRSQDAARLSELAQHLTITSDQLVKLARVVEEINTSLLDLTAQLQDLEEEVDRLNRG
jgi:chromosome segregation ATPase